MKHVIRLARSCKPIARVQGRDHGPVKPHCRLDDSQAQCYCFLFPENLTAGQQAIDYLSAKGEYSDRSKYPWPDVIVLDLKMPEVNGFDFLAWRKASPLVSLIPVIIFSGSNKPDDIERIFELGDNKHIVKPAVLEDWDKVVREIWDFGAQATAFSRIEGGKRSGGR